jgi:hypothetical protein
MINIGARSGSRSRSLELRSPVRMLGSSQRPLRLPACTEVAAATKRALNGRRREGCGESLVLSLLACPEPANALQNKSISRLPLGEVTRHRVPSRFDANLLKTNDRPTCYPTLEKGVRPRLFLARHHSIFRSSGNFSPVAPRSLATSHSSLATESYFPNLAVRGPHRIAFQEESYEIE